MGSASFLKHKGRQRVGNTCVAPSVKLVLQKGTNSINNSV